MKIDKIQCDICGKIIDYNDSNFVEFMQSLKSNRLQLRGVTKDKENPFIVINIEYDLCEDCLIKIRDMIINMEVKK